jgi:superfamily II RNA helicase
MEDNRGNWEFAFFQQKTNLVEEAKIKKQLEPPFIMDFKNISMFIDDNYKSKEELLYLKKGKLTSVEKIIMNNYNKREQDNYKNDIREIQIYDLAAKPKTNRGRARFILHVLRRQIDSNITEDKLNILIANSYFKLQDDDIEVSDDIEADYADELQFIQEKIQYLDLIELQFTALGKHMPPLNSKVFKLDDWQKEVILNIDNKVSTLINAPTSAGKSILSGYAATKGKVLFIVPTSSLAWQISAYLSAVTDSAVPILTSTYQTSPFRDQMIEILNKSKAIVTTPISLMEYLPFIHINKIEWIIFDEIHMIGSPECKDMEHVIKLFKNYKKPFLALSATIENTNELSKWFSEIYEIPISTITCTKRFFNLQMMYYNNNTLNYLHPLSLIDKSAKNLSTLSYYPTPNDIWDLYKKLSKYELNDLNPYEYFKNKRITLDEANKYFILLLNLIDKNPDMKNILDEYTINSIDTSETLDLISLMFKLKESNMTPAIIFHPNTESCMNYIKNIAEELEEKELKANPKIFKDRMKLMKHCEKKKPESKDGTKKCLKKMMDDDNKETDIPNFVSLQEPHLDFILNTSQYFQEDTIKEWTKLTHKYLPCKGNYYHYIIKLLWRGIGVYTKDMPDPYLRLVQSLANKKQLAIVYSDKSLVFGISMPFKTSVILKSPLDIMLYKQMAGRAGRRGLDKEGFIIFYGFPIHEIKNLITSKPPAVKGIKNILYTIDHANALSKHYNTLQEWNYISGTYLSKTENNEDLLEMYRIKCIKDYPFLFIQDDINHLHLIWKIRNPTYGIITAYIMNYLRKAFANLDSAKEINQINMAHILCRFLCTKETSEEDLIMKDPLLLSHSPYDKIIENLCSLDVPIVNNVDKRLFTIIQNNSLTSLYEFKDDLIEFADIVRYIQHYSYHSKNNLSKILGKLLTRINFILYSI